MAARWYVIHVYSGFEKKVAQSIEEQARQSGLAERIDQVLVPVEEVVEMRRGAKVNAERKFFPGYVLVKMDMSDETWHLVKNTPKVTGFLGGGVNIWAFDSGGAGILASRKTLDIVYGRIRRPPRGRPAMDRTAHPVNS